MKSSLQLAIVNVVATVVAWLCGSTVRGEVDATGLAETATFLTYTAWPLIGMALALVAIVLAIVDIRSGRSRAQAAVAALLSLAVLLSIPAKFIAFTP